MAMPARQLVRSDSWLDSVLDSYQAWLLNQDFSPKTVRNYGIGIKNFFAYLRDQGVDDLHYLDRGLIEGWQSYLRERVPPLKATSRGLYATAVRQLIRFAAERDIVDLKLERAVVGVRLKNRHAAHERPPIDEDDLVVIMAYLAPRRPRMTVIDYRTRALFFFLLYTGLRVNEALQVTRANFVRGRVRQKGNDWVDFHCSDTVIAYIQDYLRVRTDTEPWLWVRHGNNVNVSGVLEDSGVREGWRRLCLRLGIPRFTTHQIRHSTGTQIHELGGTEVDVAEWLHHADTRTAHRYVKISKRRARNTAEGMEAFIRDGARPRLLPKVGRRGYGR